ncbi:MAG: hypothetical protein IJ955_01260 [Oscillospiraceae bacterium]|nr:hypothetical protein [Oscillospiraceae bacterium]
MNFALKKIFRPWCIGTILFALRLYQNVMDFDHVTGLALPSAAGTALVIFLFVAFAMELVSTRKLSKNCPTFSEHFSTPEKSLSVLVIGSFLLAGGGLLMGYEALTLHTGIAPLVTATLCIASCCGFLVLTQQLKHQEVSSVIPLLPVMFFSTFFVLTLYFPAASDPILARYYLPILAAGVTAYAFALLAGFFRKETKIKTFTLFGNFAVMLCIAAAAQLTLSHSLIFLSCALLLSVFLSLQKTV